MPGKFSKEEVASAIAHGGEEGFARAIRSERVSGRNKASSQRNENTIVVDPKSGSPSSPKDTMDPKLLSTQQPTLAYLGGDLKKPIVVPRPDAPVVLADVDSFLHHFTVLKGLSEEKEKSDPEISQEAVLAVMTKWNSPYTVKQDPRPEAATEAGSKVGRNIAYRCVIKKQAHLLRPIHDYFNEMEAKSEKLLKEMTTKDMEDYDRYGPTGWYYVTLMERRFADAVQVEVIKIARKCAMQIQEAERKAKIEAYMDVEAAKAIENRGGIVFGAGGGARGGYEFVGKDQWKAKSKFGASKAPAAQMSGDSGRSWDMGDGQMAPNGQMGGGAGGSRAFMGFDHIAPTGQMDEGAGGFPAFMDNDQMAPTGQIGGDTGASRNFNNGQTQHEFGLGAMNTTLGDFGPSNGGFQGFNLGEEVQAPVEHTSKRVRGPNGQIVEVGQRASYYDFMGEVQMQDEYTPARAEGPAEGIGGDYFDELI